MRFTLREALKQLLDDSPDAGSFARPPSLTTNQLAAAMKSRGWLVTDEARPLIECPNLAALAEAVRSYRSSLGLGDVVLVDEYFGRTTSAERPPSHPRSPEAKRRTVAQMMNEQFVPVPEPDSAELLETRLRTRGGTSPAEKVYARDDGSLVLVTEDGKRVWHEGPIIADFGDVEITLDEDQPPSALPTDGAGK